MNKHLILKIIILVVVVVELMWSCDFSSISQMMDEVSLLHSCSRKNHNKTSVSIDDYSMDGIYRCSDGWSTVIVEIYGDTWQGEVSFGPYGEKKFEYGVIIDNTLYSYHSDRIPVGSVSGSTVIWGRATLTKQ